ncbi:MAG: hypothetical protein ACI8PZ_006175 [Myxococcota bacterium]|jgi:hypothetical protein
MRLFNRIWPPLLILGAAAWLYDFNSKTDGDMFVLMGVEHMVGWDAQAQNLATVSIFVFVGVTALFIGVGRVLLEDEDDEDYDDEE